MLQFLWLARKVASWPCKSAVSGFRSIEHALAPGFSYPRSCWSHRGARGCMGPRGGPRGGPRSRWGPGEGELAPLPDGPRLRHTPWVPPSSSGVAGTVGTPVSKKNWWPIKSLSDFLKAVELWQIYPLMCIEEEDKASLHKHLAKL